MDLYDLPIIKMRLRCNTLVLIPFELIESSPFASEYV